MKTFKDFKEETEKLDENAVVYGSSMVYVSRISKLSNQLKTEKNQHKRDYLLSLQNKDLARMSAINTSMIAKEIKGLKKGK